MAILVKDRVKETTTTTGTGTVTLLGAASGFQSFSAIGNGNVTYYAIVGQTSAEWEVGIGTYTSSGTTLSRDTILASSNSGSAVNFSAGTKDVFVTYPASAGQLPYTFNNQTSTYTVVVSDLGKVINCTTGTFTVNLTSAATLGAGFNCWVWNSGAGTITIDPASSETIDGVSTISLSANQTTQIISNGTNWYTVGKAVSIPTALSGITNSASPFTTALGYQAGTSVTGVRNTLVGYQTGNVITTGADNTLVGYQAGLNATDGWGAVGLGGSSLSNATGTTVAGTKYIYSVGVGSNALLNQTTGYFNTAIGASAGTLTTTEIGNIFIGSQSGTFSGCSNSVLIGRSVGYLGVTTGSNNIVIGYTAAESSASASNEITLGNASITTFRIPGLSTSWTSSTIPVVIPISDEGTQITARASSINFTGAGVTASAVGGAVTVNVSGGGGGGGISPVMASMIWG